MVRIRGRLLCTKQLTFRFHTGQGISLLVEERIKENPVKCALQLLRMAAEPQVITCCLISGFHSEVDICALLGNYAAYSGNSLPTFRDNISVSFSRLE
jgi:hypothetical protein